MSEAPPRSVVPATADVALGLGASLGDRATSLQLALRALDARPDLEMVRVSRTYLTTPVGGVARRGFYNLVVRARTTLVPEALLDVCKALEVRLGRRPSRSWADRVIDVDILLYDRRTVTTNRLRIPHPRLAERAFFLYALYEAWPDAPNPWTGVPWRDRLPVRAAWPVVDVLPGPS